jgi:hypothetical protein
MNNKMIYAVLCIAFALIGSEYDSGLAFAASFMLFIIIID